MSADYADGYREGYHSPVDGGNILIFGPWVPQGYIDGYRAGRQRMLEEMAGG